MDNKLDARLRAFFEEANRLGIDLSLPESHPAPSERDRLVESFEEIQAWVDKHGSEPELQTRNIEERRLGARLSSLRMDVEKTRKLMPYDRHHLLASPPASFDEVVQSGLADIMGAAPSSIFDTSSLPKKRRTKPETQAERKVCKNFEVYRPLFEQCREDLLSGRRHVFDVAGRKPEQLEAGHFVICHDMLAYVASREKEEHISSSKQKNFRIRLIYDNGTESNVLVRSLYRTLYSEGKLISELEPQNLELSPDVVKPASDDSEVGGFIYVLRSLSKDPQIKGIKHLYKIGVTTGSVEDRVRNAESQGTYLMSGVKVLLSYRCIFPNVHRFETLIHHLFDCAQLKLEVVDEHGKKTYPREWYVVPISVIRQALPMILNGSIAGFKYDPKRKRLVQRREEE